MPVFDTPKPISVTLDIYVGGVQITAEDRTDTVVEVRPTDETDASDVKAAEQTSVEYVDGVLVVKSPRPKLPAMAFSRSTRSVDVSIALPVGSHVRGEAALGDLYCSGRLGEFTFKTSAANVRLDHVGPLNLHTAGHITVGRVDGDAEVGTATGRIRIGEIDGAVGVKNSNGNTEIGRVTGDVRARASNGDISVDHALGLMTDAKTSNGSIRVGEVTRGAVVLKTACGDLEIGIGADRPAKLELATGYGRVHNTLEQAAKSSEESIEVRAHSSYGDITIHRA
ncbi:DUF4097 family beta strand repeat-containing protein [Embleya sp. NBC_00896]|uniref:DUF4097 family beta strand repeat-containing protein n=1 Tax=Embleya sp. NBC_00896 TaxID=2975961 RepID=UPI00386815B6|nr:DUF4097 family beta strand repeat-containing protein [Embleya sp. NBC_00896]